MNLLNIANSMNIAKDRGVEVERKIYPNRKRREKRQEKKVNIVIFCGWNFVYYPKSGIGGVDGQSKRKR